MNCHSRTKFDDRSLQCLANSGFGNASCPLAARSDRTMKTFETAKILSFQTLNHFSFGILKRIVLKSNNSLCMVYARQIDIVLLHIWSPN